MLFQINMKEVNLGRYGWRKSGTQENLWLTGEAGSRDGGGAGRNGKADLPELVLRAPRQTAQSSWLWIPSAGLPHRLWNHHVRFAQVMKENSPHRTTKKEAGNNDDHRSPKESHLLFPSPNLVE